MRSWLTTSKLFFAPILEVHQLVVQRGAVVALEGVGCAQPLRTGKDVGRNGLVEESRKLGVREADAVERLEFLAEVALQRFAGLGCRRGRCTPDPGAFQ
ncbi:MAG: hypothetical protein KatS3mg038_0620 [Candidatus Kapaibacterium sp.]|nr:MAG: hypothetical protein KatS3mg038_0620 [Candidatus Kapabacteria bacterium]